MFRSILVLSCFVAFSTAIDSCAGGALPGCSVDSDCPPVANNGGVTCIPTPATATDPAGTCCPTDQVVAGATTAATATTAVCVDKVNPRTGVSDCAKRVQYCEDAVYYDVMTRQCPKTCGRCGTTGKTGATTAPTACIDLLNPRTRTSDCPSLRHLCSDTTYYALMTVQCPKTCGRCGIIGATGVTIASTTCADRINSATGTSDCPARKNLCKNPQYRTLMQEECPRTCGFCT